MTFQRATTTLLALALTATLLVGFTPNSPAVAADRSEVATFAVAPAPPGYWTPERMRAAKPLPAPVRPGGAEVAPPDPQQPLADPDPGAKAQRWDTGGAVTKTVGKVFFTFDVFDAACSASVVRSANRDTVVTAAHCIKPEGDQAAENWIFVPGYADGTAPYGKWSAERLMVAPGWADEPGGNLNEDVGFAVMRPLDGQHLADVVGSNAIAFNAPAEQSVYSFGYPAQRPFDGEALYYCQGPTRADTFQPDSTDLGLDCGMTGGSSGGPWLSGFDPATGGTVTSVNSFGYTALPDVMFGPRFDDSIKAVYDIAQAVTPTGPDPLV